MISIWRGCFEYQGDGYILSVAVLHIKLMITVSRGGLGYQGDGYSIKFGGLVTHGYTIKCVGAIFQCDCIKIQAVDRAC